MDHELMETVLRAIAGPHRLEIVRLVRSEELTAGQIAARFEVSRPAISQHLRLLRDAGLITERRQGTRRFYRGQPETLVALLVDLELLVEHARDDAVVIPPDCASGPQSVGGETGKTGAVPVVLVNAILGNSCRGINAMLRLGDA
jgi:DNA-binding transcriptional ArsR family regulator